MAGGFTQIPKLKTDLGTEGTGDRMPLFNSGGELVGYVPIGSGFLPLSGGTMTGNIGLGVDDYIELIKEAGTDGGRKIRMGFWDDSGLYQSVYTDNGINTLEFLSYFSELGWQFVLKEDGVQTTHFNFDKDGFESARVFNKSDNPLAFAQLGDIAEENKTLVPLSLSDLNTEYPTQPTGFQVICNAISLIYIKRTLDTWESIATTTVV